MNKTYTANVTFREQGDKSDYELQTEYMDLINRIKDKSSSFYTVGEILFLTETQTRISKGYEVYRVDSDMDKLREMASRGEGLPKYRSIDDT